MANVSSHIGTELYKIEIKSPTGNAVIADEPVANGGKDMGFSPKELLASSLAACTSATLRMYADRKQWKLEEVNIDINLEWNDKEGRTSIKRNVELIGELDEERRKRLLAVANACPVHKILSHQIDIETELSK